MNKWGGALKFIGVGWLIAILLILPIVAGIWLDKKLESGFIFAITGILVGLLMTFFSVYRLVKEYLAETGDKRESK